jgi:alkanesulfonate monooxygenase SsuD/methylene tetrahydromethanopterin reductase-like flavin-dependent oxidoreductase (luciferase family)
MTKVRLQFGTGTTVKDFADYREWLTVAEGCGFDLLTTGDSQSLWAEPFTSMTLAASLTTRPRLAITVSNPMTRHPAVTASAAAAVQQISGGRFAYGISSGDSALRNIGVRPSTVAELDEYVRAVKGPPPATPCRGTTRTLRCTGSRPAPRGCRCGWRPRARRPNGSPAASPTASCSRTR